MRHLIPKFELRFALVLFALIGIVFAWVSSWHRTSSQAVTGVYCNGNFFDTPEWATIHVLENDFDEPIAVIIHHGKSKPQGPSFTPVEFKSNLLWRHHYPPSIDESGIWIDGKKQPLGQELAVLYATDTNKPRYINISIEDKADFLTEARGGGDPLQFVDRWIRLK